MAPPAVAFQAMPRRGGRSLIAGVHDAILSVAEWAFTQSLHGRPT